MTKTLTVHNAEISTASVAIHTLTVNGKQVTLATFRQLYEEKLIGDDGNFTGMPWGRVNYHPDKSCEGREHEHVVWQKGTELRRACVAAPWFPESVELPYLGAAWWLDAAILDGLRLDDEEEVQGSWQSDPQTRVKLPFDAGLASIWVGQLQAKALWPARRYDGDRHGYVVDEDARAKVIEKLGQVVKSDGKRKPQAFCQAFINDMITKELDHRQRHLDRWAEIQALPQLFIAT